MVYHRCSTFSFSIQNKVSVDFESSLPLFNFVLNIDNNDLTLNFSKMVDNIPKNFKLDSSNTFFNSSVLNNKNQVKKNDFKLQITFIDNEAVAIFWNTQLLCQRKFTVQESIFEEQLTISYILINKSFVEGIHSISVLKVTDSKCTKRNKKDNSCEMYNCLKTKMEL